MKKGRCQSLPLKAMAVELGMPQRTSSLWMHLGQIGLLGVGKDPAGLHIAQLRVVHQVGHSLQLPASPCQPQVCQA